MESTLKRTWAEIDLDHLTHNYETIRRHVGERVKLLGVVKADGYGHGAVEIARRCRATTSRRNSPTARLPWAGR